MSNPEKLERILAAMYEAEYAKPDRWHEWQDQIGLLSKEIQDGRPNLKEWDLMRILEPGRKVMGQHSPLVAADNHIQDRVNDRASIMRGRSSESLELWDEVFDFVPLFIGQTAGVSWGDLHPNLEPDFRADRNFLKPECHIYFLQFFRNRLSPYFQNTLSPEQIPKTLIKRHS